MIEDDFKNLDVGDIVKHFFGDERWIVTANHGGLVTAVQTVDLTNPADWDLISKVRT